jgi:hypothetical protein
MQNMKNKNDQTTWEEIRGLSWIFVKDNSI